MDKLEIKEEYSNQTFEDIKHVDEFGNEYWYAREIMKVLEYSKWENPKMTIRPDKNLEYYHDLKRNIKIP